MQQYVEQLNVITEKILSNTGQYLDALYSKIIEVKEQGFNFINWEPTLDMINRDDVGIENVILYEHCQYLTKLRIEARDKNTQFFMNIEDDLKRNLRILYADQRSKEYFGTGEAVNSIYYVATDSVIDFTIEKAMNHHLEFLLYDQKVTAQNFIKAWLTFAEENLIGNKSEFKINLTSLVFGDKRGNIEIAENEKTLYSYLQNQMEIRLKPYREDKFADASIYSEAEFSKVFSLQYESNERTDILQDKHKNWFKDCLITIEHENNYLDAFTEMMYLTYRRARLKVLITYFNGYSVENTRTVFQTMANNFKNIISQSNSVFAENTRTEYLFILGSKLEKQEEFTWNMQSFSYSGQFKNSIVN